MEFIQHFLRENLKQYCEKNYPDASQAEFIFQETNKDHEGDLTLMVFPIIKYIKLKPEILATEFGEVLNQSEYVEKFSVIKGFLNLTLSAKAWSELAENIDKISYKTAKKEKIVLEYCGPNTNKPLHIGHLRNVFLGYSVAEILQSVGHDVHKVNINNDRGIAICKSMIAYHLFGNNETPETSNMKGDFLVGKYYVRYNEQFKNEVESLIAQGISAEDAEKQAPIYLAANDLLLKWEDRDEETIKLWNRMNQWFYNGMHETLKRIHIDFEKEYYESREYQKGKDIVQIGFQKGVFQKDETGAIYIDLTSKGLDKKYLQRANGTSIYITQDMALIKQRYEDFAMDRMIYTVGDEQNYHFTVLGHIMEAMNEPYSSSIYHLSYGMVTGKDGSKFKSREGTTADADAIIDEVVSEAYNQTIQSGKGAQLEEKALSDLSEMLGLGALKFAMLRINPKKTMPFDPREAVDLHGDTGTFIQYSFVRTNSILNKLNGTFIQPEFQSITYNTEEKNLISHIYTFSSHLRQAEENYDPSEIAHFALQLAKLYNRFYTQHSILNADNDQIKAFRLFLTKMSSEYLSKSLSLLGISAPQKM
jgi:arginyl-tRNA synthetase